MTDVPFKLKALRALTDALKSITVANGYQHDLDDFDPGDGVYMERVFRGRAWFGEEDPIPMLSILEAIDPAEEFAAMPVYDSASAGYEFDLIIQGFVNDDPAHPTDPAYLLLADIRRCLAAERLRGVPGERDPLGLGQGKNRVESLRFGTGVCRPADDVSAKAWLWLPVRLGLIESAAEPFA